MFERPKWSKVDVRLQGDPRGLSNVDSPGEQFSKDRTLEIFGCRSISADDRGVGTSWVSSYRYLGHGRPTHAKVA